MKSEPRYPNESDEYRKARDELLECRPQRSVNRFHRGVFHFYITISHVIHAMVTVPAMIARTVSDLRQGKSLAQTFRPIPRADLF